MAEKSVITQIKQQVKHLIDDHQRLAKICVDTDLQCQALRKENRLLKQQVKDLNSELARMQLIAGLAGGEQDRKKARQRVNHLMREVDKCIALLGKMDDTHAQINAQNQQ